MSKIFKTIILVLIIAVLIFLVWTFLLKNIVRTQIEMKNICEKENIHFCTPDSVICFSNCLDLGMTYFRYDNSVFGSDECWCRVNNSTKQIW